ncbi:MAG TPA: DUF1801 domain-containing protein [Thermoanaerobaculia bacterium]|nr:DUF1801 domain-containing protein [Thermoanaerobaculia bacterium]
MRPCPGLEETMKWNTPFFECAGDAGLMAAFKEHMRFGFWKAFSWGRKASSGSRR